MQQASSGTSTRMDSIRTRLRAQFPDDELELIDDSHLHAGHAGARDGRGHFRVRIVSEQFNGLRALQRHQLIYRVLGEMMQTDIHALSIVALTADELL